MNKMRVFSKEKLKTSQPGSRKQLRFGMSSNQQNKNGDSFTVPLFDIRNKNYKKTTNINCKIVNIIDSIE